MESPPKAVKINQGSNSSILTTPGKTPIKIIVKEADKLAPKLTLDDQSSRQWKEAVDSQTSVFTDALMGQLLSTITCRSCSYSSNTFESFFLIDLPIPTKPKATLRQCFEEFCKQEDLTDLWPCPQCKINRKAHKSLKIWRLPPILILCFKRFDQDGSKNDCLVSVSLEGEDLESTLAPNAKKSLPSSLSMKYLPFGFVVLSFYEAPYRFTNKWSLHVLGSKLP